VYAYLAALLNSLRSELYLPELCPQVADGQLQVLRLGYGVHVVRVEDKLEVQRRRRNVINLH